jgi:hypothetical protein
MNQDGPGRPALPPTSPAAYPPPGPGYAVYPQQRSPLQWRAYVRTSLEDGQPVARAMAEMAASGVPMQHAHDLVAEVAAAMRKRALGVIVGGVIVAAVMLAFDIGIVAWAEAQPASAMYVGWWGPVVFGATVAAYGLRLLSRVPRLP